jgi:predicted porin
MMEFFYVSTYYHGFSPGLQNAYIGASATLAEKVSLSATYHYMATATRLEGLKMALGHCVELSASYDITKEISLSAGFSYMKGTETMDRLKRKSNKGDLRWAWINLTFTPRILNLKW